MCGIAGYAGTGDARTLERMIGAVRHRGPDDTGIWQHGRAGLAHARLSIIDTSSAGHQPMVSSDGMVALVFNGEIYNYRALREPLAAAGVRFRSESDTEVILELYLRTGEAFVEKLEGMFALALYDARADVLLLARDRMGEKPLYWSRNGSTLVFGSEIKAVLGHPSVPRELDPHSLAEYLMREYVLAPRTIYRGINQVPPAHVLRFAGGNVTAHRYWTLCPKREERLSESAALARFDTLLGSAVRRQLVADVPLGVFLSGGLDSSTVAYYARQAVGEQLNTFSIGFADGAFDESADARRVAAHLGTRHHEEFVSDADALALVDTIPDVFDEPVADASVLPTLLLSRFARRKVTVALGGDGADELLLGYQTFDAERYARLWGALPAVLRNVGAAAASIMPASHRYFGLGFKAQKFTGDFDTDPFIRHLQWLGSYRADELGRLLSPAYRGVVDGLAPSLVNEVREECLDPQGNAGALSHFYARTYLPGDILPKVDRASMHFGLEVRAPFLDPAVVSFLMALPYEQKFRAGRGKWLLRKLMEGRLPASVLTKRKQGFAPPLAAWLAGPLRSRLKELLSHERIAAAGYFDAGEVARLVEEHLSGRYDHRKKLWTLFVFELWRERWL